MSSYWDWLQRKQENKDKKLPDVIEPPANLISPDPEPEPDDGIHVEESHASTTIIQKIKGYWK